MLCDHTIRERFNFKKSIQNAKDWLLSHVMLNNVLVHHEQAAMKTSAEIGFTFKECWFYPPLQNEKLLSTAHLCKAVLSQEQ